MLDVLDDDLTVHSFVQFFIDFDQARKILPSTRGGKKFPVHGCLHLVEMKWLCVKVRDNCRMNMGAVCIIFPGFKVRFHFNLFDTIHRHDIEFTDRAVVLRRISGCNDEPALRNLMISEGFALEKLQHSRSKRLRYTIDLIDEQNAFFQTGGFHFLINRSDNLAHGVFGHGVFFSSKGFFGDKRQTDGALAGVMRDGVGNETDTAFSGNLLHNLCFSDSGSADEKNGALPHGGNDIFSIFIF